MFMLTEGAAIRNRSIDGGAAMNAVISQNVIVELGRPTDFNRIEVHRLWDDHYRVNVLVGLDGVTIRIAHSYFLVSDGAGAICAATPRIQKSY